jgi:hypothetical protein
VTISLHEDVADWLDELEEADRQPTLVEAAEAMSLGFILEEGWLD